MNSRKADPPPSSPDARNSGNEGYDHIDPADIEEALTPLREAIILIRRHVEADAPQLNKIVERRLIKSVLQSEIRNALLETGPRGEWDEKVILDVLVYVGMTVTGASYILYSVGRLLYSPVSLRAVEVLSRTTLEMSARAWWMLDPGIPVRERVQRALGEELHTSRQELAALRKGALAELTEAESWRVNTTLNFARSLGIPLKYDKGGREVLDGANADLRRGARSPNLSAARPAGHVSLRGQRRRSLRSIRPVGATLKGVAPCDHPRSRRRIDG
jgi:hypothetical protein